MIRTDTAQRLKATISFPPDEPPWQWAEREVDYGRELAYEIEAKSNYNPNFMPYWKEVQEGCFSRDVKEIWVLKASRAGGSENCILTPMRYALAVRPQPMLFVSGQQESVERFLEKRVKPGFQLSKATAEKYRRARVREHEIFFGDCDLISTWPASKLAFKQHGYSLVFGDEVSTWPDYSADMLRRRVATYAFPHVVGISTPDPAQRRASENDPIFVEFNATDKRYWKMPDPRTGKLFVFSMAGLHWDEKAKREDGSWDLEAVRKSAHYLTPTGTRINNDERMDVVRSGKWVATAKARKGIRGYHLNAFYLPWGSSDFGEIAVAFLLAKDHGADQLRVFVYEYLAEEWKQEIIQPSSESVSKTAGGYNRGQFLSETERHKAFHVGKSKIILMTVDVQQAHFWWLVREWIEPGDSGLVDFGWCVTRQEVGDIAARLKVAPNGIGFDIGYEARKSEVEAYCCETNSVMLRGENMKGPAVKAIAVPRQAGTSYEDKNNPILLLQFHPDAIKTRLWQMITRSDITVKWWTFDYPGWDYISHMQAERCTDGKWLERKSHSQNHLWDCETMQVVLARWSGALADYGILVEK